MRITSLSSMLAINAAAFVMARSATMLKEVEDHTDLPNGDDTLQSGGDAPIIPTKDETKDETSVAEEAAAAEDFKVVMSVADEIPDDLPDLRTNAESIEWGFSDWAVGAHTFVPKALAQRARGAIQNARTDAEGKPNGKVFQTFEVLKVASAKKRNPNAVKGDIEVWRRA